VNIQVNGSDGLVAVPETEPVSVKVSVRPEKGATGLQDWRLCCESTFGWFSYVHPQGWVEGIQSVWLKPQVPIQNPEVVNTPLPKGDYTFHFALDSVLDNASPRDRIDSVAVRME